MEIYLSLEKIIEFINKKNMIAAIFIYVDESGDAIVFLNEKVAEWKL